MKSDSAIGVCPSREDLTAFCQGNVGTDILESLAEHISACASCATTVMEIPDLPDALQSMLRGLGAAPALPCQGLADEIVKGLSSNVGGPGRAPLRADGVGALPPLEIRGYRLLDRLGEGGMGTVYRAVHMRLDKIVALKVLAADRVTDREAQIRFEREMKAVGKLSHPNIVQATDAGEEGGIHFLVMELLEGTDLARLLGQRGALPVSDACEIARQTALGLQYAQEHGLVHRDIKPSNLMLTKAGQLKILDLGLARVQDSNRQGGQSTGSEVILGSLDYVAPEQADDPRGVDGRADLYSLGCTLYHFLAGRPPFAEARTTMQKLKAHGHDAPPPLQTLRSEVPPELGALVSKLLAKDPADRFANAAAVANALSPFCRAHDLDALLRAAGVPSNGARQTEAAATELTGLPLRSLRARRLALVLALIGIVVVSALAYVISQRPAPSQPGWVQLFNGQDLTGWKHHPSELAGWRVKDGILIGSGQGSHLFSQRNDFKDFHLIAEAKISLGGDSGIFFYCNYDEWRSWNELRWPVGLEAQIWQGDPTARKTGSLLGLPYGDERTLAAKNLVQPDTWFTLEIVARGDRVEVKVNGETTADVTDPKSFQPLRRFGHVALQVADAKTVAQFRRIEIKELFDQD